MGTRPSYRDQNRWLARTAKRVSRVLKSNQQIRGVVLTEPAVASDDEARIVSFGALAGLPGSRLELWLETNHQESPELSFWVAVDERPLIRKLAKVSDRYFPAHWAIHGENDETSAPYRVTIADRRWKGPSYCGVWVPYSVRADTRRAPALLVTDIAYFFYRIGSGLSSASEGGDLVRYWSRVPGRLRSAPGSARLFSEYECPQCMHLLKSYEEECDRCFWSATVGLSGAGAEPPYKFEIADT